MFESATTCLLDAFGPVRSCLPPPEVDKITITQRGESLTCYEI